jgi:hypothetical protein
MGIEIRRVYDMPDTRARGPIRVARVVEFMVDGQGPLFVEVPLGELDTLDVRSVIQAEAEKVRSLLRGG